MPNTKDTIAFVERAIEDCWSAQRELLDDEQPEFKDLQSQVNAYQEVYSFLTGDEYDGIPNASRPKKEEDDEVLDDDEDDEDYPEPTSDEEDEDKDED